MHKIANKLVKEYKHNDAVISVEGFAQLETAFNEMFLILGEYE